MTTMLGDPIVFAPKTVSGMASLANTAETTSVDYVLQGMGLVLKTIIATRAWVTCNGQLTNNKSNGSTDAVLCSGIGAPPVNGDLADSGTILTQPAHFVSTTGTGAGAAPFSLTACLSEIEPGADYWFDLAVRVSAGSMGNVVNVDLCAMGLP